MCVVGFFVVVVFSSTEQSFLLPGTLEGFVSLQVLGFNVTSRYSQDRSIRVLFMVWVHRESMDLCHWESWSN